MIAEEVKVDDKLSSTECNHIWCDTFFIVYGNGDLFGRDD